MLSETKAIPGMDVRIFLGREKLYEGMLLSSDKTGITYDVDGKTNVIISDNVCGIKYCNDMRRGDWLRINVNNKPVQNEKSPEEDDNTVSMRNAASGLIEFRSIIYGRIVSTLLRYYMPTGKISCVADAVKIVKYLNSEIKILNDSADPGQTYCGSLRKVFATDIIPRINNLIQYVGENGLEVTAGDVNDVLNGLVG